MSDITDVFDLIKIGPRAHLSSFVIYTRASEPYSVHGSEYTRDAVPFPERTCLVLLYIPGLRSHIQFMALNIPGMRCQGIPKCTCLVLLYVPGFQSHVQFMALSIPRDALPCGPRAHV